MKTLVTVTKADIRYGTMSSDRCPLARAIRRVVKTGLLISILPRHAPIVGDAAFGNWHIGENTLVNLPRVANTFANRFDAAVNARKGRAHLKPFSFRLAIPRDLLKPRLTSTH